MGLCQAYIKASALSAATAKHLIQVTSATTRRLRIVEYGVGFDGTSSTAVPVAVDLMRSTTAATGTSFTPVLLMPDDVAAVATSLTNCSAEPTSGDILETSYLTPNGGLYVKQFPMGREPIVGTAAAAGRIGIRCNAPAAVNATAYIMWEEF